nr:MAG TPA: hypothetical protein [Caudoviricetes sp.]
MQFLKFPIISHFLKCYYIRLSKPHNTSNFNQIIILIIRSYI